MASENDEPFYHLVTELRQMFHLTSKSVLKFLSLHIVQSPLGVSLDQTKHITTQIIKPYFEKIPSLSIPHLLYPFPIDWS
jgi:hypothetical protein